MKTEKRISALLVLWFSVTAAPLAAQVCRLSIGALNQSRKVLGPVNTECGGDPHYCPFWIFSEHSIPYGNWGCNFEFRPETGWASVSRLVPQQFRVRQLRQLRISV